MHRLLACLLTVATLSGCATPNTTTFIPATTKGQMPPPACETPITLAPVAFSTPESPRWADVSATQKTLAAQTLRARFTEAGYALVEPTPSEGLELRLVIEEVKLSRPVGSTVAHVFPIGLVLNLGKSLAGTAAPGNMGSVVVAGELHDRASDTALASFLTTETPDPMNLHAVVDQDTALKAAVERAAQQLLAAVAHFRQCPQPAGSDQPSRP